ncbi:MAG TPA: PAS domain-containing protein, partial [Planctomycetota bacterium]|nr:PAS domain-containing protein [Planctomycetota bacterium]
MRVNHVRRSRRGAAVPPEAPASASLEAGFAAFVEARSALAIVDLDPPHVVRLANQAFALAALERRSAADGRPLAEVLDGAVTAELDALIRRTSARRGARAATVVRLGDPPRYQEVSMRRPRHALLPKALIYEARDVTAAERARRELELRTDRLTEVASVAGAAGSLALDKLIPSIAASAARLCGGPTAIFGLGDGRALHQLAQAGLPPGTAGALWSALALEGRGPVQAVLRTGASSVVAASRILPATLREELARVGARWVGAIPLGQPSEPRGVMVSLWPGPSAPRAPDTAALEVVAGQVSLALLATGPGRRAPAPTGDRRLDALPDPLFEVARDGRIAFANAAALALLETADRSPPPTFAEAYARLEVRDAAGRPVEPAQFP